jgi:hypothetical protein
MDHPYSFPATLSLKFLHEIATVGKMLKYHQYVHSKSNDLNYACVSACASKNSYKVVVGYLQGTSTLARPMHRWEDNIDVDLKEIRCKVVDWIHLAKDRV